jgi:hypothetical protein
VVGFIAKNEEARKALGFWMRVTQLEYVLSGSSELKEFLAWRHSQPDLLKEKSSIEFDRKEDF